MASWVLIPCLKQLFAEFDRIAPDRDHASDGSIGNAAHQKEVSDHNPDETGSVPIHDADHLNEVHAIDVDNNLNIGSIQLGAVTFGDPMEGVVQFLLDRCRRGLEKRLRYIIYKRRIWSASSGWVQKTYTGVSPHTEHAHFSASYVTELEASTASWHLEEIPVALTAADRNWLTTMVDARVDAAEAKILAVVGSPMELGDKIGDVASTVRTVGDVLRDEAKLRGTLVLAPEKETQNKVMEPGSPLDRMVRAADAVLAAQTPG